MADEWDELESLVEETEKSTAEFVQSTRGGAGSPIERRMADAFTDLAKTLAAQARALEAVSAQQGRIEGRLDDMERAEASLSRLANSVGADVRESARREIRKTLSEYGTEIERLHGRTDDAIDALGRLDGDAADSYRKAVEESAKRLKAGTAGAIAAIAALSIIGGILAAVGAFLSFQVFPPLQAFAAEHGMGMLVGIVVAIAIVVYLLWSIITAKRY